MLWLRFSLFFLFASMAFDAAAQDTAISERKQVAIFTPLYLDSAFDYLANYRYGKNFPKFINPGLEFYEGCLMAIDSLDKEGIPLDIHIYDTRISKSSVNTVLADSSFNNTDLIIGHVNANEAKALANFAARNDVPFINATYPNDAGVENNPNYIILNSTLFTHCNAIYKFIQKYHAINPVVLLRKGGRQEDRLQNYFTDISRNTNSVPLKIKYVTLPDNFEPEDVQKHLQSGRTTIVIAGSFDLDFGKTLAQHLATVSPDASSILIGMPNWWEVTDFSTPEYKGIQVIYTTPFYLSPADPTVVKVLTEFRSKYYSRPTDMVYRGYETLYHFGHLLHKHGKNFNNVLSEKTFHLFTDYDIQPVIDSKTTTLDYFENKKIYFIKKADGVVTAVY